MSIAPHSPIPPHQSAISPADPAVESLAPPQEPRSAESLDQVREILFGAQSREADRRIAAIEERITATASELREDFRQRCASLEAYIKKEVDSLAERLRGEQQKRSESLESLTFEARELANLIVDHPESRFVLAGVVGNLAVAERSGLIEHWIGPASRLVELMHQREATGAIVTATGMHTEMGRLANLLADTAEGATPLQIQLDQLEVNLGDIAGSGEASDTQKKE
mgnify:CR=1 FL=1